MDVGEDGEHPCIIAKSRPYAKPRPFPLQRLESLFYKTMPDPFEEKLQRQINSCGPCCSCLVTAALIILLLIYLIQR